MATEEYSRIKELTILISIFNDLSHNYPKHNTNLLEELVANLRYRKEKEKETVRSKSQPIHH